MQFTTITTAAALAFASYVQAGNTAYVKNHCTEPVWIWSVTDNVQDNWGPFQVDPNAPPYTETFRQCASGGVSIKIATEYNGGNVPNDAITQFEYTYVPGEDLWYDISNINGYPFENGGLELIPSTQGCPSVTCTAGSPLCAAAYNTPEDNWATAACPDGTNLTLNLCAGQATSAKPRDGELKPRDAEPAPAPEAAGAPIHHAHGEKHLHTHQRRHARGTIGLSK